MSYCRWSHVMSSTLQMYARDSTVLSAAKRRDQVFDSPPGKIATVDAGEEIDRTRKSLGMKEPH